MANIAVDSNKRQSLEDMLLAEKLVTLEQLEGIREVQRSRGGQLSDVLVDAGLVSPQDMAAILSVQMNVPFIDLQRHKVQPNSLRLIPESIARKHTLIPLDVVGDSLIVVMADPQDVQTIQDIQAQAKIKVEVALGIRKDIQRAIDINYRSSGEIEKQVRQFAHDVALDSRLTTETVARTPIAQAVDLIIAQAVRDRASDIHIEPQENRLRIRFRIDGTLYDMFSLPISAHVPLVSRIKILSEMNISEQRRPQDGQMSCTVGERTIDIRVASLATIYGERMTLRILDKSLSLFTLTQLGLLPDGYKKIEAMLKNPYGLVLVGGPTGSGKTTTLYAMINSLNQMERNIMTVEDPVEYHFQDINQTQVNTKAGITFATGLRALMRHDPNIILVGEIRDKETASIAIQAALTGHLVLSSIHANSSVGVLFRLIDLGIEPYLITSTLIGISTQRMVRLVCPHCHSVYQPSPSEIALFQDSMGEIPETLYARGTGCNLCAGTGFQGRTGIFEVLPVSEAIRRMLLSNVNTVELENQAIKEGLVTIKQDGLKKAKEGIISVNEVMRSVFSVS